MSRLILPEQEEPQIVAGAAYSLAQRFGEELGEYIHNVYAANGQPQWFSDLRQYRESLGDVFVFDDFRDPRFILSEQAKPDSTLRELIPGWNQSWLLSAKALRKRLNMWGHHRAEPSIQNLKILAELMLQLVSGFEMESDARALISRCAGILNNTYTPKTHVSLPQLPEAVVEIEKEVERYEETPPIGSRWLKPTPARKLKLIKSTHDLVESGQSVKDQLGPNAEETLRKWFIYFPQGGEVFVDDKTGAAIAYKKGDAHLIGWFGVEPDYSNEVIRGFFLPREYIFQNGDVVDLGSHKKLTEVVGETAKSLIAEIAAEVQEGESLFITDYGDIAVETETGDFRKVAESNPGNWFPGFLPS